MWALYNLLRTVIDIYIFVILVGVILSWLVAFDVVNMRNQFVRIVYDLTHRLTEPALRPIRRILPDLGGIDISPMILFLLLFFARDLLAEYWPRIAG